MNHRVLLFFIAGALVACPGIMEASDVPSANAPKGLAPQTRVPKKSRIPDAPISVANASKGLVPQARLPKKSSISGARISVSSQDNSENAAGDADPVDSLDDLSMTPEQDVDINRKSKECKQLVLNAVKHLQKVSVEKAMDDFLYNQAWRRGDMFVFVFTVEGVCLAHGDDSWLIWRNIMDVKGIGATPLIKEMAAVAQKGGRISYLWDNGFKACYVKSLVKSGNTYILGSGFFPENNEFATKQLVKTAIAYFQRNGGEATFGLISNPNGPFVKGDIYMFAYDLNGVCVAHGNNPALVGQNLIDLTDSRGFKVIRGLIDIAKTKGKGWLDYMWRNEFKRSYVEKVVDPKTKKSYLISAGYYPNMSIQVLKSYVNRAIRYIKANGSKLAFAEFSNLAGEFAQGGLGVFVFDLRGKCLANGVEPAWVGQNVLKIQGAFGRYYVKDMIEAAKKNGKALVSYWDRNANAVSYVEKIDIPDGKFIIGATFYPASKTTSAQTLVSRAVDYFKENTTAKSFKTFSTRESAYIRGDLRVFVYDGDGTLYVDGKNKQQLWRNIMRSTDQTGKTVVKDIITIAENGGGWYQYRVSNANRKVYVKPAEKNIEAGQVKKFIVGTGYFV